MEHKKAHWEKIYSTKTEDEVSWFQPYPSVSIENLEMLNLSSDANIIDVGGGDSHFADALLDKGFKNITVLDISSKAIERAKQRLGAKADMVNWIISDVTEYQPPIKFDLWHDRAAFHFLTTEAQIKKYVSIAEQAITNKGYLILETFSENGPDKCSGLPVKQYNRELMSHCFEANFKLLKCINNEHKTPFNTIQKFLFCIFQKKKNG